MATESVTLIEALIDDARDKREQVDEEIAEVEERLKTLRKKRSDLRDEEVVLTSVLFRITGNGKDSSENETPADEPGTVSSQAEDNDWSAVGRSEAVERAVAELTTSKGFATPADIEDLLKQRNRHGDTRDYIGASLAYLRRTHKVHTRARAEWVPGRE